MCYGGHGGHSGGQGHRTDANVNQELILQPLPVSACTSLTLLMRKCTFVQLPLKQKALPHILLKLGLAV